MKTHIKNTPQNLKTNRVILEFAVQISLNQPSYFVCADKQQPWEIQEHRLPGLLHDALCYLYKQNEWFLSSHWNPMGHRLHTHVILDSEPGLQRSCAGQQAAALLSSQEHALLSVSMWEQQSINVNVPPSENWNTNIKTSNRTKFLELHIKTELLPLKQQIKISAEVFW